MEHIINPPQSSNKDNAPFIIDLAGITFPDPSYHIYRKSSEIYCIEYVISGEGIVTVDDKTCYPGEGDIYILPLGYKQDYRSNPDNPYKKIWMNVHGTLCDALFRVYGLEDILIVKNTGISSLFYEFLECCEDQSKDPAEAILQCSIIFHRITAAIYMKTLTQDKSYNPIAVTIKNYIDRNIDQKLSMDTISSVSNISASQITKIFKKNYGCTPYKYILNEKIERARLLLLNTDIPIKNISYMLGFEDEHYFSNIFKKKCGLPPSTIRKNR